MEDGICVLFLGVLCVYALQGSTWEQPVGLSTEHQGMANTRCHSGGLGRDMTARGSPRLQPVLQFESICHGHGLILMLWHGQRTPPYRSSFVLWVIRLPILKQAETLTASLVCGTE